MPSGSRNIALFHGKAVASATNSLFTRYLLAQTYVSFGILDTNFIGKTLVLNTVH